MSVEFRHPLITEYHRTNKKSRGTNSKRFLLIHYTAGANFATDVSVLSVGSAKVSCQYVISEVGDVAKIGSDHDILWHAGASTWRGLSGLNAHSIGIELTNPGILEMRPDGKAVSWFGRVYNEGEFIKHSNGRNAWAPYPQEQMNALQILCDGLINYYPSIEEIMGHEDVSPRRKVDPGNGEIFPRSFYDQMNNMIRQNRSNPPEKSETPKLKTMTVDVSSTLRVRSGPGISFHTVGSLENGMKVDVLRVSGDWVKVGSSRWVHGAYLK